MSFWLDIGCDGFRVDMAASLVKNDPHAVGITKLWNEVRAFLDEKYPEAAMVSEWGNPALALNTGFDMDFLLPFGPTHYMDLFRDDTPYFAKNATIDIADFISAYRELYQASVGSGYICVTSGNHDQVRISEKLDDPGRRLAFAFILTMPGCPFIYYGDEIGMKYQNVPSKEGGYFRTGSRTPMQWDSSANYGFSTAAPEQLYLPIDPSADTPTVEAQQRDKNSLYYEVKKLLAIRRAHPQLQADAKIEFLTDTGYPLVYTRENEDGKILIMINPGDKTVSYKTALSGEKLYGYGETAATDGGYTLSAQSALFISVV